MEVIENELFEEPFEEKEIPAEAVYHAYDIIDREKSRKNSLSWNKSQELLLDTWAENAASYKWMHIKAARYYNFMNDLITIPIIVLSSLSAMGAVFVINNSKGETIDYPTNAVIEYVFAGANIIVATLSSIQKYKRFGETSERHRTAAVEYSKFYREIKLELVLDPKAREYANEYSKTMKLAYDKLLSSSPEIPGHISKGFERIRDQPYCKTFIQTNASIPFCL